MNTMRISIAIVGIVCVIVYYQTAIDVYYTIFMATLVFMWAYLAVDAWKRKQKFTFGLSVLVACITLLVVADSLGKLL